MASVRLEDVRKIYEGGQVAVHGINVEVKDKEFMVLVGPSGCGKSTTLRMIAGLEEVSGGKIFIDGKLVNDVPPKDRDIAMVFQNYALYPHMSVYENMAFGLKLRSFPKQEIDQRVREAAGILELEGYLDRKPKALSGGQRQRVAVGRAIVRKPKVFLFDEPLSNLDAKLRVQMRTEISKLHQRLGATMIYVTHDQTEAMTMGTKIVVMKDGYVQQIDKPLELYHHPRNKFVAGFIGSPAMNFFNGTVERSKITLKEGKGLTLSIPKNLQKKLSRFVGKNIVVGLRPEHIRVRDSRGQKGDRVKVQVNVVEPMGNELFVYFSLINETNQYVARFDATATPAAGKPLDLMFDMGEAHYFNAETEEVV
ncbi:MAG: sn-glycerol-3-phosphate ABC transporter ATP-binding protein UgpC [Bacteroidota bacterium]